MVKIKSTGFISGSILGSCFPERFSGKCFGIPKFCQPCNEVCTADKVGLEITIKLDDEGYFIFFLKRDICQCNA